MALPLPRVPRIGCAGWALEKRVQPAFPGTGTHLQRYAGVFSCVEINSSFYRPHKPETYRRWADSVPDTFRFSAKVPKEITHERRLLNSAAALDRFLSEVGRLGHKLGPLLVQLPPSLAFDGKVVPAFLKGFRERYPGLISLEARHASWFAPELAPLWEEFRIARVAADPAVVPEAGIPAGWKGFTYRRLHGSPNLYYSEYPLARLESIAADLARDGLQGEAYCIFDNTAEGHAIPNALALADFFGPGTASRKAGSRIVAYP